MKLSARSSDELRIYSTETTIYFTETTIYSTQNKFVLPKSYYGNYFKINAQIFKQLNGLFEKSRKQGRHFPGHQDFPETR